MPLISAVCGMTLSVLPAWNMQIDTTADELSPQSSSLEDAFRTLVQRHVDLVVGILQRRAQQLLYRGRHPLLGEDEGIERIFHLAAFDQIQHQPRRVFQHEAVPAHLPLRDVELAGLLRETRAEIEGPGVVAQPRLHQGLLLHSVYHWPNGWDHVPAGARVPRGEV